MTTPLDDLYLEWLYSQVASVKQRVKAKSYWHLLRQLYTKEFVWLIPNDDNRVEDGRDLRYEFRDKNGISDIDPDWLYLPCSMLELLIGLAKRASFEDDIPVKNWFWTLIENIHLDECTDAKYQEVKVLPGYVDEVLDKVIWRTYDRNGLGGLFPLQYTRRDQRKVELWYQLCAYLLERE